MVDARAVAVARRAVELAGAARVDLPGNLRLWQLAGGRPDAPPRPGVPDELGEVLEAAFTPDARRRQGAHFTPLAMAAELTSRALEGHDRPTVGDPACGGGALLLAAARHLEARGERPQDIVGRLWAIDVDPVAVATTEAALALWAREGPRPGHCAVADALLDAVAWPPLDVVVGNPPFLSPLGADTTRSAHTSRELRGRYGAAVRAYTDTATLFLLRACELAAPGGTVALLQPQSVLAARDAAGVRAAIDERGRLTDVWFPTGPGFDAAVEVCAPIIRVGEPSAGAGWSVHLAKSIGVPAVELTAERTVGDVATTTAGFRSEYYGMVRHVDERAECPLGRPLVTTGLIDLGRCAWGDRPARIGGRSWERPVVDVDALDGRAADWVRRTGGPKLVVATQTKVVEVVVDEAGEWIAGVPLVVVLAPPENLWSLAAALAAPAVSAWLLQRSAGTARTRRSLKVTAALLREVPLPPDEPAWARGTAALRAGDIDAFAAAMAEAYRSGPEVGEWWLERAKSVWSPQGAHR